MTLTDARHALGALATGDPELGFVDYDPGCIVPDDPGEVVRHAEPMTEAARAQIREQYIERLVAEHQRTVQATRAIDAAWADLQRKRG